MKPSTTVLSTCYGMSDQGRRTVLRTIVSRLSAGLRGWIRYARTRHSRTMGKTTRLAFGGKSVRGK